MKYAAFFISITITLFVNMPSICAQATRQINDSTKGYVQSCTNLNDSIELCTLCKDKNLKAGCSGYLINSKTQNVMPLALTKTQISELLAGKQTATISGLKSVAGSAPGYYYYESSANTTTVYKSANNRLLLLSFANSSSLPARSSERVRTPAELQALNECLDLADRMYDYCLKHNDGSIISNAACASGYIKQKSECAENAKLMGFIGGISIQIGTIVKPTTVNK